VAIGALLALPGFYFRTVDRRQLQKDPLPVVRAYLEAIYARDFERAYGHISRRDQVTKAKEAYVREKGPYSGFTLRLASRLAEGMEIGVIDREQLPDRTRIKVRFKLPAPEDLSPLVHGWDSGKLNSLPPNQQRRLLETVEEKRKNGRLILTESQQTFDLFNEEGEWKLFFDWAAGVKVTFYASLTSSSEIEARLSEREVLAKVGEPFQITLKVKNRGRRETLVRVDHLVEPKEITERVELIMCGFLLPFELWPGGEREFSSAYVLGGGIGEDVRRLAITYEFKTEK
jgi:hypothetical protein